MYHEGPEERNGVNKFMNMEKEIRICKRCAKD